MWSSSRDGGIRPSRSIKWREPQRAKVDFKPHLLMEISVPLQWTSSRNYPHCYTSQLWLLGSIKPELFNKDRVIDWGRGWTSLSRQILSSLYDCYYYLLLSLLLVGGLNPSEKYEFVNWDDWKPNIYRKKQNGNQTTSQIITTILIIQPSPVFWPVPNHQNWHFGSPKSDVFDAVPLSMLDPSA